MNLINLKYTIPKAWKKVVLAPICVKDEVYPSNMPQNRDGSWKYIIQTPPNYLDP